MLLFPKNKALKITILVLGISTLILIYPWSYIFYKIKPTKSISKSFKTKLALLAHKSLKTNDVPVGAIILYNDSIIGTGYNTVLKDTVAFGHAEINAITGCLKKIGIEQFNKLDRNKLSLYTTLEPCEMCQGALIEYRIKRVYFMKEKSFNYWHKEHKWEYVYQYNKSQIEGKEIQDSLLELHPKYQK